MLKSEDELKETTLIISGDVQAERDHSIMYFMCVMCACFWVSPSQQLDRPGDFSEAGFSLFPQDCERDR